jgi:hypothetical protein
LESDATKPKISDYTPETYDALLSAEIILPKGDILVPAQVIKHKPDSDRNPIGVANNNPVLDTRVL